MKLDRSQMEKLIQLTTEFKPKVVDQLKEQDRQIIKLVKEAFDKQESFLTFDTQVDDFDLYLKVIEFKRRCCINHHGASEITENL